MHLEHVIDSSGLNHLIKAYTQPTPSPQKKNKKQKKSFLFSLKFEEQTNAWQWKGGERDSIFTSANSLGRCFPMLGFNLRSHNSTNPDICLTSLWWGIPRSGLLCCMGVKFHAKSCQMNSPYNLFLSFIVYSTSKFGHCCLSSI